MFNRRTCMFHLRMVRKGGGLDESATTTMPRFFKAEWIGWGFMYNKKREK